MVGLARGAQSSFYTIGANPKVSNRLLLMDLYITDSIKTKFDEEVAHKLLNQLESDVKITLVNGQDTDWYGYTSAAHEFMEKCNKERVNTEMKKMEQSALFQYACLSRYKETVEEIWKQE